MDATKETHPVDAVVGFVLAAAGIAFGIFVLYCLFVFAVLSSSDW